MPQSSTTTRTTASGNTLPPLGPQTHVRLITKLTIGLTGFFAFLQVYSVQSILPILVSTFHASEVQAGLIVGATVLAVAIMSPFLGMLSDAVGRKKLIAGSLLFLALPTALIGFSPTVTWMESWRFLQGLSVPGVTVVTIAYVGEEYAGRALTSLMSFYVAGTVLGGFMGRFFLGHLQGLIGWRHGFLVMAAITVAGAIWVAIMLPRSRQFEANPHFASSLQTLREHLTNRYVITACALGACVLFSLVGCFTFINLHLAKPPYQLSSGDLANIFVVYLLGVIITPLSSTLLDRFGAARTIVVAMSISMLGVLLTLLHPLWAVVMALAVMSSGVFITQSSTINYIAYNVPKGRSLASGLYYMSYYGGGSLGAWLCGIAYRHGQWQATVLLLVAVQLIGLAIAAFGMVKPIKQTI